MSATAAVVKAVRLLQSRRRPWYLLGLHCCQCNSACLGSQCIKQVWWVTPWEMMTGGFGDSIVRAISDIFPFTTAACVPCAWHAPRVCVYSCISGHRSMGHVPPWRVQETGHVRCGWRARSSRMQRDSLRPSYGRNGHFCTAQYGIRPYHVRPLKDTPRPWTVQYGTHTVRP